MYVKSGECKRRRKNGGESFKKVQANENGKPNQREEKTRGSRQEKSEKNERIR
jgi:hypothetical protein